MKDKREQPDFSELVNHYVLHSGYNVCHLARLCGVPRTTLASWLSGVVKKPRVWQDIIKLAKTLQLNEDELNGLLDAAGYPALGQLEAQAQNETEKRLLALWRKKTPSSDKPAPFQTIPDLPTFVGRETALRTLEEWLLADDHVTPIVLEGTVGVGKTVLAARLAYRLRTSLPDGVLWARLDTSNPMTILRQFANTYNYDVTGYQDLGSRSAIVRELLAHKRALLVLDNVQNSRQIEPLLPPTGPCSVLVTSRHRNLALVGSNQHIHLDAFTKTESMALFARILGEESIDNEPAILAAIADTVGHLPLALDIVACRLAYEPGWKTADFLTQLQRKTSLLNNLTQEERCVRSGFTVSYDELTSEQQRFFAALGAFGGEDFSVEAAAAVANMSVTKAEAILKALFCLSLVRRGRSRRYRLIPLLRAFAREKIEEEAVWQRLVDYFVTYSERYEKEIDALDVEKNNILAALAAARERGLQNDLERGLNAFSFFLQQRGLSRLDLETIAY